MSAERKDGKMSSLFVAIVIPLALLVAILFYNFVLGDPANFEGGDPIKGHPVETEPGHTFGIIHKGGFIVPILITVNLLARPRAKAASRASSAMCAPCWPRTRWIRPSTLATTRRAAWPT